MSFAFVIVEIETGQKVELALPLDVPSRELATRVMRDLGRPARTGEKFTLFIKTAHEDKRILPTATLAQLGITDGQQLRIKRELGTVSPTVPRADAYLRTPNGDLLALTSSNVIIGRKGSTGQIPLDLDLAKYDQMHEVSRRHACIGRDANHFYLLDLESTNGTRLNGQTVVPGRKMPLQDGDVIEFGMGLRVTFVTEKTPEAVPH